MSQPVRVAGSPTPEELAAVLTALTLSNQGEAATTGYALWRETRLHAIARTAKR